MYERTFFVSLTCAHCWASSTVRAIVHADNPDSFELNESDALLTCLYPNCHEGNMRLISKQELDKLTVPKGSGNNDN